MDEQEDQKGVSCSVAPTDDDSSGNHQVGETAAFDFDLPLSIVETGCSTSHYDNDGRWECQRCDYRNAPHARASEPLSHRSQELSAAAETQGRTIPQAPPSSSARDESITFTKVFHIVNIDIDGSDCERLINRFGGDNVTGVGEFVSILDKEEGRRQLNAMYNIDKSDITLLCNFRDWFEREYLPACQLGTRTPEFNLSTWLSFCKSLVKHRETIPFLVQQDCDSDGFLLCSQESVDLSSITTKSHAPTGAEHQEIHIVIQFDHQQNDGDTSVLTRSVTRRTSNPEKIGSLLEAMRENIEDVKVLIDCCDDIKELLWERGGFLRPKLRERFVKTMLCVLKCHADHPTVPDKVVSVLVAFCDVEVQPNIAQRIPVLLDESRQPENDERVHAHCLRVLIGLAKTKEDHRVSIEIAGGIKYALELMEKHMHCPTVQTNGCSLLLSLSQDMNCRKAIISAEGLVDTTIRAMQTHLCVESVQLRACDLLSSLARIADEMGEAICAANGLSSVIASLQQHSKSSLVNEKGVEVLCTLADSDVDRSEAIPLIATWIEKQSGRGSQKHTEFSSLINFAKDDECKKHRLVACVIVGWMQLNETNGQIQKIGFETLTQLCEGGRFSWWTLGGGLIMPFAVATIKRFDFDSSLQASVCLLLTYLSNKNRDRCRAIHKANGIPTVVAAMQQHLSHVGLQECAYTLLGNLVNELESCCDAIISSATAIPIVVAGMQQHLSNAMLQKKACRFLGNLSRGDKHRCKAIVEAKVIPVVVEAMQQHFSQAGLQEKACALLANLASFGKHGCCEAIFMENGIPTVAMALQQHPDHYQVQDEGCRALSGLAEFGKWYDSEYQQHMTSDRVISALVAAMKRHKFRCWHVQYRCCEAFQFMAEGSSPEYQSQIGNRGDVLEVLHQASSNFPNDKHIQPFANAAIETLEVN